MKTGQDAVSYYQRIRDEEFLELGNFLKTLKTQHKVLIDNKLELFVVLQQQANQSINRLEELERVRSALERDMLAAGVTFPAFEKIDEFNQLITEIQSLDQKNQLLVKEKMATIGQNMDGFRKNAPIRPSTSVFNKIGKPRLIDLEQ